MSLAPPKPRREAARPGGERGESSVAWRTGMEIRRCRREPRDKTGEAWGPVEKFHCPAAEGSWLG